MPDITPGTLQFTGVAWQNFLLSCTASPLTIYWNSACSREMVCITSGAMKRKPLANGDSPNRGSELFYNMPTSEVSKKPLHTAVRMVYLPLHATPLMKGMICQVSRSFSAYISRPITA